MLIRHLTSADLAALLDFYGSLTEAVTYFFQPWPEATEEVLHRHLADAEAGKNLVLALMSAEGTIEGHGFVWNVDSDQPVLGIGLRERAQGQGWGRLLMEALLAEADARNLAQVRLTVLKDNLRARNLYESVGFVVEADATFRRENDSVTMVRRREW
jgi:ribosomal protein S18 acetylase RimI-like enzyme